MDCENITIPLPPDYNENVLFLLVQSPRVLYVYWELSSGLKDLLNGKEKVQIRLNTKGRGLFRTTNLDMSQKSFYFSDVEPGFAYYCEIGIINHGDLFYPLLRSNSVTTPLDRPVNGQSLAEEPPENKPHLSSWGLPKVEQ